MPIKSFDENLGIPLAPRWLVRGDRAIRVAIIVFARRQRVGRRFLLRDADRRRASDPTKILGVRRGPRVVQQGA